MGHWHTSTSAPYHTEGAHSARILTSSSGNAQTYALDSKEGIENQNPFASGRFSTEQESRTELHFPVPKLKLGSNDHYAENLLRLQARRQHNREKVFRQRRSNPERPYLQHPKYLQYRARQRCDTGKDGKPVWDDRIEDAFQNALVNIEPMGRRKKSQRGRPHGRNELISEWIEQETGEKRSRKQVSSHIQVLNPFLKGIPEWDALITANENIGSDRPGHKYYSDSIAQMVRSQNGSGETAHYHRSGATAASRPHTPGAPGGFVDKHHLSRLSFEMWVSLPNQMDQALHIYNRLQSSNATSIPTPLEDVKNWRMSFPSLRPIVDSTSKSNACDIILLEASFRLMSDFPPKSSKLGISLELDFLHPSNNNGGLLAALDDWSCRTHVFQHGRLVKEVAHDDCHVAGIGKVKPFFESKWWAMTFTQLTEKRKMAEDSKSDAAIELANESSRNFFRGLTVMQEISAGSMKGGHTQGIWTDQPPREKRMAILLWKFSQAPNGCVGTTTWHKVIAPLERINSNSPPPTDIALPNLTMDGIMSGSHGDNLFDLSNSFITNADQQHYNLFSQNPDDSLYHNSFMDYKSNSMADFGDARFDLHTSDMPLYHDMNMSLGMPPHALTELEGQTAQTTNFLELPHLKNSAAEHRDSIHTISQHESFNDNDSQPPYQPLAKFDMSTHKMLQAQLGDHGNPFYSAAQDHPDPAEETHPASRNQSASTSQPHAQPHLDEDDEALRAALLAASAMSDLGNHLPIHNANVFSQPTSSASQPDPLYIPTSHPFTSPSTFTSRPPLQSHHSFAGIGTDHQHQQHTQNHGHIHSHAHNNGFLGHSHTHTHSRNSSKNDFASLLANLQAYTANSELNFPFDFGNGDLDESMYLDLGMNMGQSMNGNLGIGMGISRPMSQPVMSGAGGEEGVDEDVMEQLPASLHEGQTRARLEGVEEGEGQGEVELGGHVEEEEGDEVEDGFVVVKQEDCMGVGVGEVVI